MATHLDYGSPTDTLATPSLSAWAAAVAAAITARPVSAAGIITIGAGAVAAGSQYTVAIVFPAGRFTTTPAAVTATFQAAAGVIGAGYVAVATATSKPVCTVSGLTASGCSITVYFPDALTLTASHRILWTAHA